MASELLDLEQRLRKLQEDVREQRVSKLAAEDEGTKILQAADSLPLQEERARRRLLIQQVNALLDAAPSPTATHNSKGPAFDELLSAGEHLLAEMAWLSNLTSQAIAYDEDAYLISIIPRIADLDEVRLVRKLREWAAEPPPSHAQACKVLVRRIDELDAQLSAASNALSRPAESDTYTQKACCVYSKLLRCMEGHTPQTASSEPMLQQLLEQLLVERNEVKSDIAFLKERFKSLRCRHGILRCLGPETREAAAQMTGKELRLCLHIHKMQEPSGAMTDKQEIIDQLVSAGVVR
ncbi:unnamed protein product [Effrenium voratum]|nr:unnamed protein product [Effrenium voratum]